MNIKLYSIVSSLILGCQMISAQFTIVNPLKTADSTGLKIGDNAYLTAFKGKDANGEGWLRLTEAAMNKRGYIYIKQSFPTTLGVTTDFEYTAWRDKADGYNGADGFTLFLFDGSVAESDFKLGGYGGSLGYAPLTQGTSPTPNGLTKGYIGLGFDAYGNYARAAEGRTTGTSGYLPNSIVLRGNTTNTASTTNKYLANVLLGTRSGTDSDIRVRNEIDYNTIVTKRPDPTVFYRRVQVSITKSGTTYVITVKWRKQNETAFTTLLTHTMDQTTNPLPPTLKLGFAGSTGGGWNMQELRNILITTPGNIRVDSRSNLGMVCKDKKTEITYSIEVTNDTAASLNAINYSTKITDSNNTLLDLSKFKIKSVILSNTFTNSTVPTTNFTTNQLTGVVGLPANTSGIVTIVGEYIGGLPTNSTFRATSDINTSLIVDTDLTNNTSTSTIDIRRCNIISNPSLPIRNY